MGLCGARPGELSRSTTEEVSSCPTAQDLFKRPDYAQFRGVSYFDREHGGGTSCVWHTDSSASSMAAFIAMGSDTFYGGTTPPPPDPEPSGTIGFVVSSATTPGTGDAGVASHLQAAGRKVQLIDDNAFAGTDLSGLDAL